jgi:hypothetical protein
MVVAVPVVAASSLLLQAASARVHASTTGFIIIRVEYIELSLNVEELVKNHFLLNWKILLIK